MKSSAIIQLGVLLGKDGDTGEIKRGCHKLLCFFGQLQLMWLPGKPKEGTHLCQEGKGNHYINQN